MLPKLTQYPVVAAVAFVFATAAHGDPVCDVALKSGAFNTTDFAQTTSIVLKARDEVCKSEYNSASEAVSAAQQSGGSVGAGGWSIGLSDARSSGSGKYSVKDSRYCAAKAEDLDSFTSVRARQQIADSALNAWSKCVEITNLDKLFIVYKPMADGSGMTGSIRRKAAGENVAFGTIEGIQLAGTAEAKQGVACRVDNQDVRPDSRVSIPIRKSKIAISCSKSPTKTVALALNVSVGDQEWIHLDTAQRQEQVRIQQVQDAANANKRELSLQQEKLMGIEQKVGAMATNTSVTDRIEEAKAANRGVVETLAKFQDSVNPLSFLRVKNNHTAPGANASCFDVCASPQDGFSGQSMLTLKPRPFGGQTALDPTHCFESLKDSHCVCGPKR